MTILDEKTWTSSIFSRGWTRSKAGDSAVVEPATGTELGRVGVGGAEDISLAAAAAAAAQPAWAATNFEERAAVLRRAGALFEEHAAEIEQWLVREAG
jgi:benzaldehyde dehydrogenase (NAD)